MTNGFPKMSAYRPLLLSPLHPTSAPSDPFSFPSQAAVRDDGDHGGIDGEFGQFTALDREGFGIGGRLRFAASEGRAEDDADHPGVCSPPLWKTSPPSSPMDGRTPPRHRPRSLSPASRTQAIANGRRELMEMVRHMPESSYELSLKDLVDHHRRHNPKAEVEDAKSKNEKARMKKSESVDNGGFLLKMVFPIRISLSRKKKKKKKKKKGNSGVNTCSKVSPKPPAATTTSSGDGSGRDGDKEWWKKRLNGSQSSSNCSSSSR